MIKSIQEYKEKKKILTVLTDIKIIIKIYNLTLQALKHYSKYASVMEIMSNLQNNKTLLEIQHNKYNRMLSEKYGRVEEADKANTDSNTTK